MYHGCKPMQGIMNGYKFNRDCGKKSNVVELQTKVNVNYNTYITNTRLC